MKTYKTIFLFAAMTGLFFLNSCKSGRGIEDQKTITSIPLVEPGDRLTLPTADGSTVTVTVLDGDNDGKADGIDFAGDGLADFSLIDLENPAFFGIDLSGDAQTDYYLGKDENGEFQIFLSADSSGGNGVTITLGPSGDFIGLDTDGNGFANIDFSGNVLYPPAAVRNPNTAVNFTYLTITWDKVAGTDSYNLYWSTTSGIGISGTLISHVRSPYIHRGLANGTKYFYVITAVNAAGESDSSVEFSGTPSPIPRAPSVNVAVGDTQLIISWNRVLGADSYNLYWSLTSGTGTYGIILSNVNPPYVHTGLPNDKEYFYVVTAINADGVSALSVEVSGMPVSIPISSLIFADANLETCVTGTGATYVSDLTSLSCNSKNINDVSGIEALTSLTSLLLNNNNIADGVTGLTALASASSIYLNSNSNLPCTDVGILDDTLDGDANSDNGDGGSLGIVRWNLCVW